MVDRKKYDENDFSEWIDLNSSASLSESSSELKGQSELKENIFQSTEPNENFACLSDLVTIKKDKTQHPKANETKSEKNQVKDIKPWEISLRGDPLSETKKEPTPYEEWIRERTKKEGKAVECPKCGNLNYDLPYITGQKCKRCGAEIEEFENIVEKMAEHDEETGVIGATRLSTGFMDVGTNLKALLAIPTKLHQDPIPHFEYVFHSSTSWMYIFLSILSIILFTILLPLMLSSKYFIVDLIVLTITISIEISILLSLAKTSRVINIRVDENSVTFSGFLSSTHMKYEDIISISNERELNAWVRTTRMDKPAVEPIFFFFFWRYLFYYWLIGNASFDNSSDYAVDSSSSSPYYTNNITISTATKSVEYSFCGAGNVQFVRALAIIIFMTKKKNPKCLISPLAIKAAEKGSEHYSIWQRRKYKI